MERSTSLLPPLTKYLCLILAVSRDYESGLTLRERSSSLKNNRAELSVFPQTTMRVRAEVISILREFQTLNSWTGSKIPIDLFLFSFYTTFIEHASSLVRCRSATGLSSWQLFEPEERTEPRLLIL